MKRISVLSLLGLLTLAIVLYVGCQNVTVDQSTHPASTETLKIVTWNVRGYPEKLESDQAWFADQLTAMDCEVICIQEIANQDRINLFMSKESYPSVAFLESSDGQDNAIFARSNIIACRIYLLRNLLFPHSTSHNLG